jgi:hypothetical protein
MIARLHLDLSTQPRLVIERREEWQSIDCVSCVKYIRLPTGPDFGSPTPVRYEIPWVVMVAMLLVAEALGNSAAGTRGILNVKNCPAQFRVTQDLSYVVPSSPPGGRSMSANESSWLGVLSASVTMRYNE